jgi:hypothetical protein
VTGPKFKAQKPDVRTDVIATVIAECDSRMARARQAFSSALLAHVKGRADAAVRTREALAEIDDARLLLARLNEETDPQGENR